MSAGTSIDDLREQAARMGLPLGQDDLERVAAFLEVLVPQLDELRGFVPPGTPPAGLYLPAPEANGR